MEASSIAIEEVFTGAGSIDFASEDALLPVVVAQVQPKDASQVLQFLSKELPLLDHNLHHLKRMRKSRRSAGDDGGQPVLEVVLCAASTWEDIGEQITQRCPAPLYNLTVVQVRAIKHARLHLLLCCVRQQAAHEAARRRRCQGTSRRRSSGLTRRIAFGRATSGQGKLRQAACDMCFVFACLQPVHWLLASMQ